MLDMDSLFQGISHFHFSGITIAMSRGPCDPSPTLLEEAKRRGIVFNGYLNLRTKMISVLEAKYEFSKFARFWLYCFGIDPLMIDDQNLEMSKRDYDSLRGGKSHMQLIRSLWFQGYFPYTLL